MQFFAYVMVAVVGLPSLVRLLRELGPRPAPVPQGVVRDAYEAAFLSAGPGRVADTVLAVLTVEERIEIRDLGLVALRDFTPRDPVEAAFLDAFRTSPTSALYWLRIAVMRSQAVQAIGDSLAGRGMVLRPGTRRPRTRRGLVLALIGLVLCAGTFIIPYVAAAMMAFAIIALVLVADRPRGRVTTVGQAALDQYRWTWETDPDLAAQVALFGRTRIADRELYLQLTNASGPGAARRHRASPSADSDQRQLSLTAAVVWCGGGSSAACGGSSCGGGGDGSGGGGGGSSCSSGGSCGGGSSCGGGGGGGGCGGGS